MDLQQKSGQGPYIGKFPTSESNVEFTYTVHGIPSSPPLTASISGPNLAPTLFLHQVATLVNTSMSAGFHEIHFDAANLSSGMYIARMVAAGQSGDTFTKELKMQLVK